MRRIFERTDVSEFTLSSIAANTTGYEETLTLADLTTEPRAISFFSGKLEGVNVACQSEDFDVSIRSATKTFPNSMQEIYRYEGADSKLEVDSNDVSVAWINGDTPRAGKLYMVVTNADLSNATGPISVRLTNLVNRRFKKDRG